MKNNHKLSKKHAVKEHHFALAPYKGTKQYLIPLDVVNAVFDAKSTSTRAWRKYLGLRKKPWHSSLGLVKRNTAA